MRHETLKDYYKIIKSKEQKFAKRLEGKKPTPNPDIPLGKLSIQITTKMTQRRTLIVSTNIIVVLLNQENRRRENACAIFPIFVEAKH